MRDFSLEVHFSKWEFVAKHNLAGSDCQPLRLTELLALASPEEREAYESLSLGYTETFGANDLLARIAATYDTVEPAHLLCFAGAEEAIYVLHRVLLSAEDHALVVTPSYQSAETLPLSICEVSGVPLDIDRGWELDVDRLRAGLRPNTRLVSLNFPHNPTGALLPRASLEAIVELCRERGIWLFNDEVYRLLEHGAAQRLPQVVDLYERGLSLNVMSKAYGLAGLRIGWLASKDRSLIERCERYKHYLSICNSAPSERLATIALGARDEILERNRVIVADNLQRLETFFSEWRELFVWRRPDAGCIAFVRYLGDDGVEAFTEHLLQEAGVLLLPSSVYRSEIGEVPANCFRIGFGHSDMHHGLAVLDAWLRARR